MYKRKLEQLAAVSCSPMSYRLGRVGFGFWLTGKLGRAWVWFCAWVVGGLVRLVLQFARYFWIVKVLKTISNRLFTVLNRMDRLKHRIGIIFDRYTEKISEKNL